MKILADENVHIDIVNGLRNKGIEVLFVPEVGLSEYGYRIHRHHD